MIRVFSCPTQVLELLFLYNTNMHDQTNTPFVYCILTFWGKRRNGSLEMPKLVEGMKGFMALMAIVFSNYIYSMWPKILQHVKKSLYNQPKPYFFKKILWSHFWIDFNKFYPKTFRIVYILMVYLLIMFIWVLFICS
jgi:hypothetical protein